MSLWIVFSVFAAFVQNLRFMLQRHLKVTSLSTGGATYARFLFALPFLAIAAPAYLATGEGLPALGSSFWPFILAGGVAQILATACVVALFGARNFTVGIALKKSEVILTALTGMILLGEGLTTGAAFAIAVGFAGVILLSDPPKGEEALPWRKRLFNQASGYGLSAGLLFGLSATTYRGATLAVESEDALARALITLTVAVIWQVIVMSAWLIFRERDQIAKVIASWRLSIWTGLTSILGSFGWFVAFALQNAAYVKAVGQVELIFTFLGSYFVFKERSSAREITGVLLIVASVLLLVLAV